MVVAPGMGEDGSTVVSVHEYLSLALLPGHTVQFRVATRNDVSRSNFFPTFSCCPNFFFLSFSKQGEKNSRWKSRKKGCNFARPATFVFFTIVLSSSDYLPTENRRKSNVLKV